MKDILWVDLGPLSTLVGQHIFFFSKSDAAKVLLSLKLNFLKNIRENCISNYMTHFFGSIWALNRRVKNYYLIIIWAKILYFSKIGLNHFFMIYDLSTSYKKSGKINDSVWRKRVTGVQTQGRVSIHRISPAYTGRSKKETN